MANYPYNGELRLYHNGTLVIKTHTASYRTRRMITDSWVKRYGQFIFGDNCQIQHIKYRENKHNCIDFDMYGGKYSQPIRKGKF